MSETLVTRRQLQVEPAYWPPTFLNPLPAQTFRVAGELRFCVCVCVSLRGLSNHISSFSTLFYLCEGKNLNSSGMFNCFLAKAFVLFSDICFEEHVWKMFLYPKRETKLYSLRQLWKLSLHIFKLCCVRKRVQVRVQVRVCVCVCVCAVSYTHLTLPTRSTV